MSIIVKMKGVSMGKTDYRELAAKIFCFSAFILIGILFFKYLFSYVLPFLISWLIGYLVYPLAKKISIKAKISRRICSFVIVFLLLTILVLLVVLVSNRIVYELQDFVGYLNENSERIAEKFEYLFDFINSIGKNLPIINNLQNTGLLDTIRENINILINNIWESLLEKLGDAVPDAAKKLALALPDIFLVSLITVIACFYFAIDIDVVNEKVKQILPSKTKKFLEKLRSRVFGGLKKYLKAYFVIFIITFAELFIGFWILKVEYAFVLAILIAFIDFLPVFGTGAILVPWGIISLLMKNYYLGAGILILFVIMTIVRQVIEPKILGKSLGIHPILSLVAVYVGYKLFGLFGMIFLPIAVPVLLSKDESKINQ